MTSNRVELRIRRLEVDAGSPPSRAALCAAVEAELAVRLGLAPAGRAVRGHRAGPADAAVTALGREIALAVLRELGDREPPRSRAEAGERRS
ncbi:hypothetical protein [Streptomyces roseolus]|uniref:hypothetical protein n=1 Tax=Streptomyces roseolus TaxID=67358 RepID=UPI0036E31BEF